MSGGDFFVFGFDLLAFERGQTAQLHVEDGVGLQLCQLVTLHQFLRAASTSEAERMI